MSLAEDIDHIIAEALKLYSGGEFFQAAEHFAAALARAPVLNRATASSIESGAQRLSDAIIKDRVAIGDRAVFVSARSPPGFAISTWAGAAAYGEICSLTDLVERFLTSAPAEAQ